MCDDERKKIEALWVGYLFCYSDCFSHNILITNKENIEKVQEIEAEIKQKFGKEFGVSDKELEFYELRFVELPVVLSGKLNLIKWFCAESGRSR